MRQVLEATNNISVFNSCLQLRNLLTRSILGYVDVFADHRKLPRIEMELILQGSKICFSPTMQEVCDMIVSVVHEVSNQNIKDWLRYIPIFYYFSLNI